MQNGIKNSDLDEFKSTSINKKLNIIALDNDTTTLTALNMLISSMGHQITAFSCSTKAVECLMENNFDIALIDYRIPGKENGINIINKINEINIATQCFLVTGDNYIENHNSISIINKPLTIEKLKKIFSRLNTFT